jgi:uncharacterized protein DUF4190
MIDARSALSSSGIQPSGEEISALPIWAVTLGIFALLTFGLTAVPSIICGHLARARTSGNEERRFENSIATVGLAIGYFGTAVLALWIGLLLPYLLR